MQAYAYALFINYIIYLFINYILAQHTFSLVHYNENEVILQNNKQV